jgi:L-ascorbate metabolism protein UlaG (beta-lactamase superfamily)
MKKLIIFIIALLLLLGIVGFIFSKKTHKHMAYQTITDDGIQVTPISHATMALHLGKEVIITDPVGGADLFTGIPTPNIIVVTDIHPDHMDAATLKAISKDDTIIVIPQAVKDKLPDDIPGNMVILHNGEKTTQKGIEIEAIPMYNIPEKPDTFHTKGRGNGYVLSESGKRVYIAGDTSAIPEMKALKDITIAFVPMNLPYTMSVEEAAEGVAAFKPKIVHPYHYRGINGFSDVNKFKELVNAKDPDIKVELLKFYPEDNK